MRPTRSHPGLIVSAGAHVSLLVLTLVAFSSSAKFDDASEASPVETISAERFNQIMKGEKTAPPAPAPKQRVDKVADLNETKPTPPVAEAKKDVPLPPPPRQPDTPPPEPPKREEAKPVEPKVEPKPPEPVKQAAKPEKPIAKAEPDEDSKEPDAVPKPPVRPKEAEVKPVAKPEPPKPDTPTPPAKPQLKTDEVARLLAQTKSQEKPKPVTRPKSSAEPSEEKSSLDLSSISKMLDKDRAQQKASTGRELSQTASLGSPTASAARMSPSVLAGLDGLMQDQYKACWSYFGLTSGPKYVAQIRVRFAQDGSLNAEPVLINPPSDPALRSLADSAMRAVRKCNPLRVPVAYAPYYNEWKARVINFDPEDMR